MLRPAVSARGGTELALKTGLGPHQGQHLPNAGHVFQTPFFFGSDMFCARGVDRAQRAPSSPAAITLECWHVGPFSGLLSSACHAAHGWAWCDPCMAMAASALATSRPAPTPRRRARQRRPISKAPESVWRSCYIHRCRHLVLVIDTRSKSCSTAEVNRSYKDKEASRRSHFVSRPGMRVTRS